MALTIYLFLGTNQMHSLSLTFIEERFWYFFLITVSAPSETVPRFTRMRKRDFTLEELRAFDGRSSDGRVLIGILGNVYDVTRGRNYYGPGRLDGVTIFKKWKLKRKSSKGGPYSAFAGRDASRGLATFDAEVVGETYDDLSDLKPAELEQVTSNILKIKADIHCFFHNTSI